LGVSSLRPTAGRVANSLISKGQILVLDPAVLSILQLANSNAKLMKLKRTRPRQFSSGNSSASSLERPTPSRANSLTSLDKVSVVSVPLPLESSGIYDFAVPPIRKPVFQLVRISSILVTVPNHLQGLSVFYWEIEEVSKGISLLLGSKALRVSKGKGFCVARASVFKEVGVRVNLQDSKN